MSADRIRLTISVTPESHEVFTRMAEAAGISLGKCMGDWLHDTIDGAQFVALQMEKARKAPKVVMREMQALAQGLVAEVNEHAETMRKSGPAAAAEVRGRGGRAARPSTYGEFLGLPPSSNTGGKVPRKNPKAGRS